MRHLVNTLQLDITCASEDDAFNLRHHLAPLLQQQVAEAIEKSTRHITDPDEQLIIDRIEIDLGNIAFQGSDQAMASAVEYEINRQLTPYLQPKPIAEKKSVQQQHNMELFRHFMLTGSLPWWAQPLQPDISNVFTDLIDTHYEETAGFLYENRLAPAFWQRLVYQLKPTAKIKLASSVQTIKQAAALLTEAIGHLRLADATNNLTGLKIQQPSAGLTEPAIIDILLLNAPSLYTEVQKTNLLQALILIVKQHIKLQGMEALLSELKKWNPDPAAIPLHTQMEDIPPVTTGTDTVDPTEPEPEKYFVAHAGIILLAPYLNSIFTRLQLLEDGQWKNPSAGFKAIHLLKYLACGETGVAEYGLIFEKILCGLSPLVPVPADAGLEPHELSEADSLLQSVIENWKKLGNTSLNGLRESFLKRDGILTPKENNWRLQVERKTLDVLLDSIPWGFSTTRLPWNNYLIFTEW